MYCSVAEARALLGIYTTNGTLSIMRGKLNMQETLRNWIQRKQKLACEFDKHSENNLFNQILKTTIYYLLIDEGVDVVRKSALKKILLFFDGIVFLKPSMISWGGYTISGIIRIIRC